LDLVIEAFNELPDKNLIVIGSGPEKEKLISKASSNIKIIGHQETEKLKVYMQKAKAFVFAAEEDFGIIVVEAMACGTPVIAWSYGGTGESVIDGETGILFSEQTKDSIIAAVKKFEGISGNFNPELIRKYSKNFSRTNFENKIKNFVDQKVKLFFKTKKH
jgi:glycosyltransferase involved in cell wall biosynthesis